MQRTDWYFPLCNVLQCFWAWSFLSCSR